MRAVKLILGILLASAGIIITAGSVFHILRPQGGIPTGTLVLVLIGGGLLPVTAAIGLLRATLTVPCKACSECGCTQQQASILKSSYSPWPFLLGGFVSAALSTSSGLSRFVASLLGGSVSAALWGASRGQRVRCAQCGHPYVVQTRCALIARVFIWIFIFLWIVSLLVRSAR